MMIYIEKGDKVPLPVKYHKWHNICVILYDLMLGIGKDRAYRSLRITTFPLTSEERKTFDDVNSGGIKSVIEYLVKTERKQRVVSALAKNIFSAVLADFLSFIYESLSCARRGHMTVAFNLLRKPLTDELLILEQLLINSGEFIERIHFNGDPNLYDPSSGRVGQEKIKTIIKEATKNIGVLSSFFTDAVYEFRYDKTSIAGLNSITNQAHHIVTMDKKYVTQNKSLNLVFSTSEDTERYWNQYYMILPYLLVYSSCVMDAIAHQSVKRNQKTIAKRNLKRYLSMAFWGKEIGVENKETNLFDALTMEIICKKCNHTNSLKEIDFSIFYEADLFLCAGCLGDLLRTSDISERLVNIFKKIDN